MGDRTVQEGIGPNGGCILRLSGSQGEVFVTDEHSCRSDAMAEIAAWSAWTDGVIAGNAESIYYIVNVPKTWVGGIALGHAYSGLRVKIGKTRNILTRLSNLQTGASGRIFVHALEPNHAGLEAKRHRQFESDRRIENGLNAQRRWHNTCSKPG